MQTESIFKEELAFYSGKKLGTVLVGAVPKISI